MSNEDSWFLPTLQLVSYSSSPNSMIAMNACLSQNSLSTCLCTSTEIRREINFIFNTLAKIYQFIFFISITIQDVLEVFNLIYGILHPKCAKILIGKMQALYMNV